MDRLKARHAVVLRLTALQAAWSYERMQGPGFGWAAQPALHAMLGDGKEYRAALARASTFFNANPYLAGAAVGAQLRAEADAVPGPQIDRLRTALCGPLGALGDRLYWTGLVPLFSAVAVVGIVLGARLWVVAGVVLAHNVLRLLLAARLLGVGWEHGMAIGQAVGSGWLPRVGDLAALTAALVVGVAVPVSGTWVLDGTSLREWPALLVLTAGVLVLRHFAGRIMSVRRLTMAAAVAILVWKVVLQ